MPDGRRPGLWKTLVAAAQTALARAADGLEAAADGLRSLAQDRAPAPPTDPRLAGVDPAIAAYVAAQDPEWFSFDVSSGAAESDWTGGDGPLAQWDASGADDPHSAAAAPKATAAESLPVISERFKRRPRPSRGKPTAAELPAGRRVPPPRISFRRSSREAPDPESTVRDAGSSIPGSNPKVARAGDSSDPHTPTAGNVTESGRAEGFHSRPAKPAHEPSENRLSGRAKRDREPPPPHPVAPGPRAPGPSLGSSSAVSSPIAFPSRPVGSPAFADATQRPAQAGQPPREAASPVPRLAPATASPHPQDRADQVTRSRPESLPPIAPPVRVSRRDRTVPAPWPELPPSTWSAPPTDSGGALAWAGPSPSDVLVDEQRST